MFLPGDHSELDKILTTIFYLLNIYLVMFILACVAFEAFHNLQSFARIISQTSNGVAARSSSPNFGNHNSIGIRKSSSFSDFTRRPLAPQFTSSHFSEMAPHFADSEERTSFNRVGANEETPNADQKTYLTRKPIFPSKIISRKSTFSECKGLEIGYLLEGECPELRTKNLKIARLDPRISKNENSGGGGSSISPKRTLIIECPMRHFDIKMNLDVDNIGMKPPANFFYFLESSLQIYLELLTVKLSNDDFQYEIKSGIGRAQMQLGPFSLVFYLKERNPFSRPDFPLKKAKYFIRIFMECYTMFYDMQIGLNDAVARENERLQACNAISAWNQRRSSEKFTRDMESIENCISVHIDVQTSSFISAKLKKLEYFPAFGGSSANNNSEQLHATQEKPPNGSIDGNNLGNGGSIERLSDSVIEEFPAVVCYKHLKTLKRSSISEANVTSNNITSFLGAMPKMAIINGTPGNIHILCRESDDCLFRPSEIFSIPSKAMPNSALQYFPFLDAPGPLFAGRPIELLKTSLKASEDNEIVDELLICGESLKKRKHRQSNVHSKRFSKSSKKSDDLTNSNVNIREPVEHIVDFWHSDESDRRRKSGSSFFKKGCKTRHKGTKVVIRSPWKLFDKPKFKTKDYPQNATLPRKTLSCSLSGNDETVSLSDNECITYPFKHSKIYHSLPICGSRELVHKPCGNSRYRDFEDAISLSSFKNSSESDGSNSLDTSETEDKLGNKRFSLKTNTISQEGLFNQSGSRETRSDSESIYNFCANSQSEFLHKLQSMQGRKSFFHQSNNEKIYQLFSPFQNRFDNGHSHGAKKDISKKIKLKINGSTAYFDSPPKGVQGGFDKEIQKAFSVTQIKIDSKPSREKQLKKKLLYDELAKIPDEFFKKSERLSKLLNLVENHVKNIEKMLTCQLNPGVNIQKKQITDNKSSQTSDANIQALPLSTQMPVKKTCPKDVSIENSDPYVKIASLRQELQPLFDFYMEKLKKISVVTEHTKEICALILDSVSGVDFNKPRSKLSEEAVLKRGLLQLRSDLSLPAKEVQTNNHSRTRLLCDYVLGTNVNELAWHTQSAVSNLSRESSLTYLESKSATSGSEPGCLVKCNSLGELSHNNNAPTQRTRDGSTISRATPNSEASFYSCVSNNSSKRVKYSGEKMNEDQISHEDVESSSVNINAFHTSKGEIELKIPNPDDSLFSDDDDDGGGRCLSSSEFSPTESWDDSSSCQRKTSSSAPISANFVRSDMFYLRCGKIVVPYKRVFGFKAHNETFPLGVRKKRKKKQRQRRIFFGASENNNNSKRNVALLDCLDVLKHLCTNENNDCDLGPVDEYHDCKSRSKGGDDQKKGSAETPYEASRELRMFSDPWIDVSDLNRFGDNSYRLLRGNSADENFRSETFLDALSHVSSDDESFHTAVTVMSAKSSLSDLSFAPISDFLISSKGNDCETSNFYSDFVDKKDSDEFNLQDSRPPDIDRFDNENNKREHFYEEPKDPESECTPEVGKSKVNDCNGFDTKFYELLEMPANTTLKLANADIEDHRRDLKCDHSVEDIGSGVNYSINEDVEFDLERDGEAPEDDQLKLEMSFPLGSHPSACTPDSFDAQCRIFALKNFPLYDGNMENTFDPHLSSSSSIENDNNRRKERVDGLHVNSNGNIPDLTADIRSSVTCTKIEHEIDFGIDQKTIISHTSTFQPLGKIKIDRNISQEHAFDNPEVRINNLPISVQESESILHHANDAYDVGSDPPDDALGDILTSTNNRGGSSSAERFKFKPRAELRDFDSAESRGARVLETVGQERRDGASSGTDVDVTCLICKTEGESDGFQRSPENCIDRNSEKRGALNDSWNEKAKEEEEGCRGDCGCILMSLTTKSPKVPRQVKTSGVHEERKEERTRKRVMEEVANLQNANETRSRIGDRETNLDSEDFLLPLNFFNLAPPSPPPRLSGSNCFNGKPKERDIKDRRVSKENFKRSKDVGKTKLQRFRFRRATAPSKFDDDEKEAIAMGREDSQPNVSNSNSPGKSKISIYDKFKTKGPGDGNFENAENSQNASDEDRFARHGKSNNFSSLLCMPLVPLLGRSKYVGELMNSLSSGRDKLKSSSEDIIEFYDGAKLSLLSRNVRACGLSRRLQTGNLDFGRIEFSKVPGNQALSGSNDSSLVVSRALRKWRTIQDDVLKYVVCEETMQNLTCQHTRALSPEHFHNKNISSAHDSGGKKWSVKETPSSSLAGESALDDIILSMGLLDETRTKPHNKKRSAVEPVDVKLCGFAEIFSKFDRFFNKSSREKHIMDVEVLQKEINTYKEKVREMKSHLQSEELSRAYAKLMKYIEIFESKTSKQNHEKLGKGPKKVECEKISSSDFKNETKDILKTTKGSNDAKPGRTNQPNPNTLKRYPPKSYTRSKSKGPEQDQHRVADLATIGPWPELKDYESFDSSDIIHHSALVAPEMLQSKESILIHRSNSNIEPVTSKPPRDASFRTYVTKRQLEMGAQGSDDKNPKAGIAPCIKLKVRIRSNKRSSLTRNRTSPAPKFRAFVEPTSPPEVTGTWTRTMFP